MEFGILNQDTETVKDLTIKNVSQADTMFTWEFQSSDDVLISHVFDVFPISEVFLPGDTESFHVTFFNKLGDLDAILSYEATAMCRVLGGPDYTGQCVKIKYIVEPQRIDFGVLMYDVRA